MIDKKELAQAIEKLFKLKTECHLQTIDDLGISDLSLNQLKYLKHFNQETGITTSKLAEDLDLTKPTVTEMVKKFIKWGYVYKESCPYDGRVYYLKLTDKGQKVANVNELVTNYLAERLSVKLNHDDLQTIIEIFNKIE